MRKSTALGFTVAMALSAGVGHLEPIAERHPYEYRTPKRRRGHWGGKDNCQKPNAARAAAKRARKARRAHRG